MATCYQPLPDKRSYHTANTSPTVSYAHGGGTHISRVNFWGIQVGDLESPENSCAADEEESQLSTVVMVVQGDVNQKESRSTNCDKDRHCPPSSKFSPVNQQSRNK
eukprot:gb/GECG01010941.1/.p1 GENE.gb/GECG01010941.1/~~gb/GECG01010941.1/.p1  ORF type:complete len:106 (+),score=7.57 gb/GECG01010941.1/:1-318(+)